MKQEKKKCEIGKRDRAYQETLATVLEHWVITFQELMTRTIG